MLASAESVAGAAARWDDMPPVLFSGSGEGSLRHAAAEAELDRFLGLARESGRAVFFDRVACHGATLDDAVEMSSFDTTVLVGKRPVCVIRRVDDLAADTVPRLKRILESNGAWWVMSAASTSKLADVLGFFLVVRPRGAAPSPGAGGAIDMRCLPDVSRAVAGGASVRELSCAFARFAMGSSIPRSRAIEISSRLDVDLHTNRRPLLLTLLIEDAMRDVHDESRSGFAAPRARGRPRGSGARGHAY